MLFRNVSATNMNPILSIVAVQRHSIALLKVVTLLELKYHLMKNFSFLLNSMNAAFNHNRYNGVWQ